MSGVLIGIGLLLGRDGEEGSKEPAYEAARLFLARFRERFGATECPALIGFDLASPVQRGLARAAGVGQTRCAVFLEWGARYLADLLERHPFPPPGGAQTRPDPGRTPRPAGGGGAG